MSSSSNKVVVKKKKKEIQETKQPHKNNEVVFVTYNSKGSHNFQLTMKSALFVSILLLLYSPIFSTSFPLSTFSRWIIDSNSGHRVKLACVNWASHLQPMFPEGLQHAPLRKIAEDLGTLMGFNCVRLTWATDMFTEPGIASLTVDESLQIWNLMMDRDGVEKNNPELLNLTLRDAQKAVIDELGAHKIMVILDNHVNFPQWCCNEFDEDGFFGETYFDPKEWLDGLGIVAQRYKGNPTVVAMSLRNELRGPHEDKDEWFKYMEKGAAIIHKANPDLLVIVSGLNFDMDLSFVSRGRPFVVPLNHKLVFEVHRYPYSDPQDKWMDQPNVYCANMTRLFMKKGGFLFKGCLNPRAPLFVSEFGVDMSGGNEVDNRHLSCFSGFLAENDLDWALWALQGNYMMRQGKNGLDETYGMYDQEWKTVRNPSIRQKLRFLQRMTQDPNSKNPSYYIMYHLRSGLCVEAGNDGIIPTNCTTWSQWRYHYDGDPILLLDGSRCITAVGEGLPVTLTNCSDHHRSEWKHVSSSKLHLATMDDRGKYLCLELDSTKMIFVTNKCFCVDDDLRDLEKCLVNPDPQWFKFISTNI